MPMVPVKSIILAKTRSPRQNPAPPVLRKNEDRVWDLYHKVEDLTSKTGRYLDWCIRKREHLAVLHATLLAIQDWGYRDDAWANATIEAACTELGQSVDKAPGRTSADRHRFALTKALKDLAKDLEGFSSENPKLLETYAGLSEIQGFLKAALDDHLVDNIANFVTATEKGLPAVAKKIPRHIPVML